MNGCFTADTITLTEPDALVSTIESVFDYNGYDISCYGQSDGAINLMLLEEFCLMVIVGMKVQILKI